MLKIKSIILPFLFIVASLSSINAESGVVSSLIGFTTSKISHNKNDGKIASDIYNFLNQNNNRSNYENNRPDVKIIRVKTDALSGKKYLITRINGVKKIFPIVHGKIVLYKNTNSPSL